MKVIPSVIKLVRKVVDELRRLPPQTRYSFPNNMAQFLSMEIWFAIWRAGLSIHVRSCLKIWSPQISWVDHPENPWKSYGFSSFSALKWASEKPSWGGLKASGLDERTLSASLRGDELISESDVATDGVGWDGSHSFYPLVMTFTVCHRKSPFVIGKTSINLWAIEKPWLIMWMS